MIAAQILARIRHHFDEMLHLEIIIAHGSINRAAQAIGISQSALTRSVARLEAAIGVLLLDRTTRGILPTIYCTALLPYLRAINSELHHAAATLDLLHGGKEGRIAVGATIGPLQELLPSVTAAFLAERPGLRIRVMEGLRGSLLGMLRTGELDLVIAITFPEDGESDLLRETILEDRAYLFTRASNPLLEQATPTLRHLSQTAAWVLPLPTGDLHHSIAAEFRRLRVPLPTAVVETSSAPVLKSLVRDTDRLAISTGLVFREELHQGSVVAMSGEWALPPCRTVTYRNRGATQAPGVNLFAGLVAQTARQWSRPRIIDPTHREGHRGRCGVP